MTEYIEVVGYSVVDGEIFEEQKLYNGERKTEEMKTADPEFSAILVESDEDILAAFSIAASQNEVTLFFDANAGQDNRMMPIYTRCLSSLTGITEFKNVLEEVKTLSLSDPQAVSAGGYALEFSCD